MAHSLLLSPVGPTPTWLNKSDKRLSGGSLAPSSITHGKNDKSQARGEEEDFGQGIDIVYDRLSIKEKSDRTKESDVKNGGDKEKQSPRVLENSMIDIVAVGGLEAHPKQTWIKRRRVDDKDGNNSKSFKDGPSCIADPTMLPKELPNSRIMTFYYASDWRGLGKAEQHQPVSQRVEAVADILLRDLKRLRKHCPKRPIIFLSHSLGGIVVEKAVVLSKLRPEYLEIYHTIAGCVFLGAPFKGSLSQAKAAVVAKAGAVFDLTDYTPLLELTKRNNQHLADMLSDFFEVVKEASIQIFCFYELQKSDMSKFYKSIVPLGGILPEKLELVVDMESSTLQGMDKRGLNKNHFNLNKFESNKEREWTAVSSVLTSMAAKAPRALRDRRNALPDKVSSETYLEILTALAAMEVDPDVDVKTIEDDRGQAVTDSAALIFRNEKINKWLGDTQTGILWISLHPGMSSAMMAVAFYRHVEEELWDSQTDDYLCYFFCDSKNIKKNNTMSVLKAFVRQMLKKTQRLASSLPFDQQRAQTKKQNVGNSRAWDSFSNLKLAFLAMLRDNHVNSVTIVLDSLHKIDEDNRHEMLGLIAESLNITSSSTGRSKIKWICFSLDRSDIKSTMEVQQALNVTATDLGTPSELVQYLKSLVRDRVLALNKTLRYSREYIFWLKTEILSRAEGNTAWVDLALGEIQKVAPQSIDVRSFVENLKQDLNPLYRQIQARVLRPGNEGLEYTKEILRTMMTVFHNPTLQELAVLAGLPPEIWDDPLQIRSYVNRCGSFVKIVRGKRHERVHFTDSTALEYLNQEAVNDLRHHDKLSSLQHGILALRCLNFLMKPEDEKKSAPIRRIVYPKEFWLNHAQKACEELPDLVEDFDLNSEFWRAGSPPWWPKLSSLTRLWPTLSNLSVLHLAAYFNFPVLLDYLLGKGSIHKGQVNAQDTLGRTPLYWAAVVGHFDVAQQLVANGAEINPVFTNNAEGLAPLYGAAEGGHIEILKWLLERGALVDTPNDNYGTALCAAANNGNVEAIDLLLKAGASKLAPSKWIRGSALGSACYFGHPAAAKLLLQAGFETNVPDADGIYPMVHAIKSRDVELIQLFLHKGANLDSRQNALEAAALNGFEEAIRLILLAPARLSLRQALLDVARLGYTSALDNFPVYALSQRDLDDALYLASDTEKTEVVEKLIFMGANANARGQEYGHALQAAAWDGPEKLIRVLVKHGANVNEIGGRLGTPLQAAAFQGSRGIIEFLLQSGARINEGPVGEYGNALYAAAAGNNLEALKTLVEYGADVNAYGGELKYALLQSARCANAEMVRYLVEHGADVNRKADDGVNAILLASYTLPAKELRFLYEHGANIHARDQGGNTVLIGCSHCQDLAAVQWLIDVGVDVNAISLDFGSALQAAATTGQEQICELLLKNGADVNQFDDYNPPSLIRSAEIDDRVTFNMLLRYGADINFSSRRWGNVIEAAIRGSAAEILGIALEETGSDVNMLLRDQGSPLHMASLREYSLAVIQLLLSKGASLNVTGGKYHTPLQAAAYAGSSSIVTLYLENGADKSLRGGFYETAANAAAARGKSEILSNLLSEDDGSAKNEALHYAIHYHQYEIVETLLDDLNADAMSTGKWGNVFQALSTGLSANEINSDDETANNMDGDREVTADSDDESEDGKKAKDAKSANKDDEDEGEGDDEDEEVELTDEEKVQRIDTALRNALKKKGVDYRKLVREPLRSNLNRSKSYAYVMKKRAKEEIAAKRANSNKSFGGTGTPPVPAVDYSRYAPNKNVRDSLDLKLSTGFRDSQYLPGELPALTETIPPTQQYHQESSMHGQVTTNQVQQLPSTFSPQLTFRVPTLVQARAIHGYKSITNGEFSLSRNEIVTVLDRPRYEGKWKVQKGDGTIDFAPAEIFLILPSDAARRSVSPPQQSNVNTEIPPYVDNQDHRSTSVPLPLQTVNPTQQHSHRNNSMYDEFSPDQQQTQYYQDDNNKTYIEEPVYQQYQPQQEYQNNVAYQSQQYQPQSQPQQDQSRYSMHQFQGSPIQTYNGYQQQDGRHRDSYVGPY